jgi:hypothetical protein
MARSKSGDPQELQGSGDSDSLSITPENIQAVRAIIDNMVRIKMDQEALGEDVKAVAAKMGVKPAAIKEMAQIVMKEQEKGGVLDAKQKSLSFAEKVLEQFDKG